MTLGLRGALNRALEGPIFWSVSGFWCLEYGIVDAEMIDGGCFFVSETHTEAVHDFVTSLSSFEITLGLRGGSKQGAGGPHI